MAKEKLEFEITGDSAGAEQAFSKVGVGTIAFGNILADLAKQGVQMVIDGVQKLGSELINCTKVAAESQRGQVALASAMASAGTYSKEAFKAATDYAEALQQQTVFDNDAIIAAQKSFSVYGIQGQQLKDLTKATLDFASAKQMDLASAADLVAKSVGTESNALKRVGVDMGAASDMTGRAEAAVKQLTTLFGGRAVADAQTFSGGLEQMKNLFGDLEKEIGLTITNNKGLQVIFVELKKVLIDATQWVSNHKTELAELVKGGIIFVLQAFSALLTAINFCSQAWTAIGNVMAMVYGGILVLALGFVKLFEVISGGLSSLFAVIGKVVPGFSGMADGLKSVSEGAKETATGIGYMLDAVQESIDQDNAAADVRSANIEKVKGFVDTLVGKVAEVKVAFIENGAIMDGIVAGSAAVVDSETQKTNALIALARGYTDEELLNYQKQKTAMTDLYAKGKITFTEYYDYLDKAGKKFNTQEQLDYANRKKGATDYNNMILAISSTQADAVLSNQKSLGSAMEDAAKASAKAIIDTEIDKAITSIGITEALEIGKASLGGFLSFGLTLLAIPLIAAASTAAKGLIHGLVGFSEGGIVGANGQRIPLPSFGSAGGDNTVAAVRTGEVIGTPGQLAAAGIGGLVVNFNNYGPINNVNDIQTLANEIGEGISNRLRRAL